MSDYGDLDEFMKKNDLEEYTAKLIDLGVKRLKHVIEVAPEDLDSIGMKTIEKRRFLAKAKDLEDAESKSKGSKDFKLQFQPHNTVRVQMPTSSFGQADREISKEQLIKEYGELYYTTPISLKHKVTNNFVLGMCSSAKWRYRTQTELYKWERTERDKRWLMYITFSSCEEIANETEYFKCQSINYKLKLLCKDYKQIMNLLSKDLAVSGTQRNLDDISGFNKEMKSLLKLANESQAEIDKYCMDTINKSGRNEEYEFWKGLKEEKSFKVLDEIQTLMTKAAELENATREAISTESSSAAADINVMSASERQVMRGKKLNKKKALKRKATRAEVKILQKKQKSFGCLDTFLKKPSTIVYSNIAVPSCRYPLF